LFDRYVVRTGRNSISRSGFETSRAVRNLVAGWLVHEDLFFLTDATKNRRACPTNEVEAVRPIPDCNPERSSNDSGCLTPRVFGIDPRWSRIIPVVLA